MSFFAARGFFGNKSYVPRAVRAARRSSVDVSQPQEINANNAETRPLDEDLEAHLENADPEYANAVHALLNAFR